MAPQLNALTCGSLIGLVVTLALRAWITSQWRLFLLDIGGLTVFSIFLNILFGFPVPKTMVSKSATKDWMLAIALYICMLAGMLSQYVFRILQKQGHTWSWASFVAPVFASPIVFIPLLASFEATGVNLRNSPSPRLMISSWPSKMALFWKEYFDDRKGNGRA